MTRRAALLEKVEFPSGEVRELTVTKMAELPECGATRKVIDDRMVRLRSNHRYTEEEKVKMRYKKIVMPQRAYMDKKRIRRRTKIVYELPKLTETFRTIHKYMRIPTIT